MTKAEKKAIVKEQVDVFLTTTSITDLINSRQKIIDELSSCTFKTSMQDWAQTAIILFGNELAKYIHAANNSQATPELKLEQHANMVFLLTLVDLSTLP